MFEVSKEVEFDAGHRVPNHGSKCRNPHGHRYRVRATIEGELVTDEGSPDEGMLADFGDLKQILMNNVHDSLDHGFIIHMEDEVMRSAFQLPGFSSFKVIVFPYIPTAENMALWVYDECADAVAEMGFRLCRVEVWETPTSLATYIP
jgi:6-pyruvoyltetrahydropterin/6-carboxytetrahydropterin synthase